METKDLLQFFTKAPSLDVLDRMAGYLQTEYRADIAYLFEATDITEELLHEHLEDGMSPCEIVDLYMRQLSDRRSRYAASL